MGGLCGGSGEKVTYQELIPPETRDFRRQLYNFLGGVNPLWKEQIPSYPGTLPYTQQPDMGQMAGLNTILNMLGYGPYMWGGMPGIPPATDGGGGNGGNGGNGGGGGNGGNGGGGDVPRGPGVPPYQRGGYKPERPDKKKR